MDLSLQQHSQNVNEVMQIWFIQECMSQAQNTLATLWGLFGRNPEISGQMASTYLPAFEKLNKEIIASVGCCIWKFTVNEQEKKIHSFYLYVLLLLLLLKHVEIIEGILSLKNRS